MKFKVGDKVKVVRTKFIFKNDYIGRTFTIDRINPNGSSMFKENHYGMAEKNCIYVFLGSELELVVDEKIVITHDGKTTTATLYRDGEKVKATAKCAPDDNFDFMVGAKLAMERLVDKTSKPEPPKPKYYNGKVVCVSKDGAFDNGFTVGKVYKIVDGKFIDNQNEPRPMTDDCVTNIKDLKNDYFSKWGFHFIPYVE